MRRLLRLRSFWCCALVLLLLGGLWITSWIAPRELQFRAKAETLRLKHLAGTFEIEREFPHLRSATAPASLRGPTAGSLSWSTTVVSRWSIDPLTPAPQAPYFPSPAWVDWHEAELTVPSGTYNVGTTSIEAWRVLIGSKQMNIRVPHWLAMLAWLLLCLPLLAWRWWAAKRRAMDGSQAAA